MGRCYMGKIVMEMKEFSDNTSEKKLLFQFTDADHTTIPLEDLVKPYVGKEMILDLMLAKKVFENPK